MGIIINERFRVSLKINCTRYGRGRQFSKCAMSRRITDGERGKPMKLDKNVFRYLTLITQFGIYMLVPIFLCSFAGMF